MKENSEGSHNWEKKDEYNTDTCMSVEGSQGFVNMAKNVILNKVLS